MAATLPTLTRTVNLSGLSGNPGDLDPLFYPVESAPLTTLTYGDQGGQPGFEIDGTGGLKIWVMTGVPLAAYHDNPAASATTVTVEWEQRVDDAAQYGGGPIFYHLSDDHYGLDGAGYLLRLSSSGTPNVAQLFTRSSDAGAFSQVGSNQAFTGATWGRFRLTLSPGTGSLKTIKLDQHTGGSWSTVHTFTDTADTGDMFGVGWMAGLDRSLLVRGPDGAAGPVITFKGPSLVATCIGQSEFIGNASGFQTNSDQDLYSITRQGTFLSPLTDPWIGSGTGHSSWSGITSSGTPMGGFGPDLAKRLKPVYPTQGWNVLSLMSGSSISEHSPAAATTRYLTSSRGGCRDLMTTILAGDGRTPGQTLVHFCWQGTRDTVLATTESAYKTSLDGIVDRVYALFPTSDFYLALIGDRTYANSGTVTSAQSLAIRRAQQQVLLSGKARAWFDDEQFVGSIGTGSGWNNPGDTLHPGAADNVLLSIVADESFLPRQWVVGGLDGVVLSPSQSFDNAGQTTTVPAGLGDIDGVTDQSFRESVLAYIGGNSSVVDNGDGTKTITYKKQDGTTNKLGITFNTAGEFISTTVS